MKIMAKVAVENQLQDVKEAVQNSGFEVVSMDQASDASCCVITGQDINVMGMSEATTPASVIHADGLSTSDIVDQVNRCVQLSS
jgi:hypothetical protein